MIQRQGWWLFRVKTYRNEHGGAVSRLKSPTQRVRFSKKFHSTKKYCALVDLRHVPKTSTSKGNPMLFLFNSLQWTTPSVPPAANALV
jgi:hypothetical protein